MACRHEAATLDVAPLVTSPMRFAVFHGINAPMRYFRD